MVTGDIRTVWATIILVIGAINVLRAIPTRDASEHRAEPVARA